MYCLLHVMPIVDNASLRLLIIFQSNAMANFLQPLVAITTVLPTCQEQYWGRSAVIPDNCLTDDAGGTTGFPHFPAQQQAR